MAKYIFIDEVSDIGDRILKYKGLIVLFSATFLLTKQSMLNLTFINTKIERKKKFICLQLALDYNKNKISKYAGQQVEIIECFSAELFPSWDIHVLVGITYKHTYTNAFQIIQIPNIQILKPTSLVTKLMAKK